MKAISFRFRIALLSALISGSVLLAFGVASWYLLYRQKVRGTDTEIRSLGTRHPGWLASRASFDRLNASLDFIFGEEHRGKVIFLVKDARGGVLYIHPGWPKGLDPEQLDYSLAEDTASAAPQHANPAGGLGPGGGRGFGGGRGAGAGRGGGPVVFTKVPRFFTVRTPDSAWRLGLMGNDDLRLVVGLNFDSVQAELNRMRNVFLTALPVALVLIGGGGWLVAGRALRPLETISRTAEQVTARGLDQRIPVSNEDPEIRRVIDVLNGMMDRLEKSFRQATRFSADASHELKTPLAIMQAEMEAAIQNAAPGSAEQRAFGNLLEETQQLKRITSSLLLLAQADSGQLKLAVEKFSLSDDMAAMVEDARILAAESNIQFQLDLPRGVTVEADRGLLRMALLNLITNAVRYNEPGGSVSLGLKAGNEVALTVCNSGPGIPPPDQERIFDRFYRVRPSGDRAVDGLGLGLSLAREIIQAHQGRLLLLESRPGRTCFGVFLKRS
jgi:signal transduction histidine kinase